MRSRNQIHATPRVLFLTALFVTLTACAETSQTVSDPYANGATYPWDDTPITNAVPLALKSGENFLSDLTWKSASSGWGPVEKDKSNGEQKAGDGKTITINGTTYTKGLGVHALASLVYSLNGQCSAFNAEVGLDDEVDVRSNGKGSVVFQILSDGLMKFESGVMRPTDAAKPVAVDLTSTKELKLQVTSGGDDLSWDHADWGAARVTCTSSSNPPTPPGPPTPPPPSSTSVSLELSKSQLERPGLVTMTASVTGASPTRLEFYRGTTKISEDSSAPYSADLALTKTETSSTNITARAVDSAGKVTLSDPVTLKVAIAGRVLYASPTGDYNNDGLSEAKPVTLQRGVDLSQPGDTVLATNGEYTQADQNNNVVTMNHSGTSSAWIAIMAYPGQRPLIRARNWNGISVQSSYIIVEGFEIAGNRDEITLDYARSQQNVLDNPITGGSCIGIAEPYNQPGKFVHHIVIRNNIVYKCPGGGINSVRADYMTFEDNVVWGNSYYAPYATSGVSMYQNWNSDGSTGVKNIIRRNIIHGNENFIPFYYSDPDPAKRNITDGNGIIIDDSRNTQSFAGSTGTPYAGRTLIENNIVYGNGGRGIHVFSSDHVDIFNNTTYQNSSSPAITDGEITTIWAGDVRAYNNIIVPRADRPANQRAGTTANPSDKNTQRFDYNLVFGGTGFDGTGTNNLLNADSRFVNVTAHNFRLQTDSPAINAGSSTLGVLEDILGIKRPLGAGVDIGAYEIR